MRTEGLAILAATALHAGLLLVARHMPPPSLLLASDMRELRPIEIELPAELPPEWREPQLPIERSTETEPVPRTAEPDRPEARAARAAVAPPSGPQAPMTAEPMAPDTNPQPGPAPTSQGPKFDDLPPDDRRGVLGVPGYGTPAWAIPGVLPTGVAAAAPAPTTAPAPRPVDRQIAGKIISEELSKRDKEKGIDHPTGGTVATAVASALQVSDVPNVARGTIEVRLGPSGQVLGVRVVSMSGGTADQWERVAAAAKAALAGRALPMTGDLAKGATVMVSLTSNDQPPAGGKGGWSGTGASFDLSNIGGHNSRHVRRSFSIVAAR